MSNKSQRTLLFDIILSQYGPMVSKICYMYGCDDEQRKDLYQECMANVWQGLRTFRGDSKLSTWLYRTCINTCITSYRRNSVRSTVPLDNVAQVADDDDHRGDKLRQMYNLISQLSPVDRAIIMMWLDEKNYDEIGDVTGMPRNTVASRIRRIKAKLIEQANA
ncbi:MAG: sigma-70 family RNA polymerase sigma factor [Muribaculaceae bacterium]|nr:sigma-70 family RNA polymerase sigma factor [Muribaculaceae bacterium]